VYTVQDAYQALRCFKSIDYEITIQLAPGISARFNDAGHMLGSAIIEIWVSEEGQTTKLVFSGDLGQPQQPLIQNPALIEDADYMIIESTYGGRRHSSVDREEKLAGVIERTIGRGGNVIIPAFAVGRTQVILYYLNRLHKAGRLPAVPVVVDSPLAIAATEIFRHHPELYDRESEEKYFNNQEDPLTLPDLRLCRSSDESRALNNSTQPSIIISASGMLDAGRILHHVKHNLWRAESTILLVGYQAQGSLGRRLVDGATSVRVLGEEISVAAEIVTMDGFSAHADQRQILDWLSHLRQKPANVFIVHGESENADPLAELIAGEVGCPTYIPNYLDWVEINGRQWQVHPSGYVIVEPAVRQFFERWSLLEDDVRSLRQKMEQAVRRDGNRLSTVIKLLDKVHAAIRKAVGRGRL
ncbi:MAG: MBL fold metallo-hydrolase, partial [Negativicutes bacterium]|nr:MBL fold metallo-hydrolase [Negativicutes bacterium]